MRDRGCEMRELLGVCVRPLTHARVRGMLGAGSGINCGVPLIPPGFAATLVPLPFRSGSCRDADPAARLDRRGGPPPPPASRHAGCGSRVLAGIELDAQGQMRSSCAHREELRPALGAGPLTSSRCLESIDSHSPILFLPAAPCWLGRCPGRQGHGQARTGEGGRRGRPQARGFRVSDNRLISMDRSMWASG